MTLTRRDLLKTSTLLALTPTIPSFLAQTARAANLQHDGRVLVVLQLDGGNDGINTVVSFADEGYAKYRKTLRLPKDRLIKVSEVVGLHPSLSQFDKLLQAGQLAIVQGVGYPNPNRSHFRSMDIWHSARLDPEEHKSLGWLGRALDEGAASGVASALQGAGGAALFVGSGSPPVAVRGRRAVASAIERPEDFALDTGADPRRALTPAEPADDLTAFVRRSMLDAYGTADRLAEVARAKGGDARYPGTALASHLELIARLIKVGLGTRVYYTTQGGYDSHSSQLQTHSSLLFELAGAVKAFLDDLTTAKVADRVVVLLFSEFGRTVKENGSAGTDHGTSGPVFLVGAPVQGGLAGTTPSLLDLDLQHGDLKTHVDFRQVYAGVLEDWLGLPSKTALAGTFERLPLFRA